VGIPAPRSPHHAQKDRNPVLRRDYALNELNPEFWVDDQDCPYTEKKRFDWYRGYHVGGRPSCGEDRATAGIVKIFSQ